MRKSFYHDLTKKQTECAEILYHRPEVQTVLFGGGAGGGKSWLGCEWLFAMSLSFPRIKSFIARKEKSRLKESTLKTFWKVCRKYGARKDIDYNYNDQKSVITFHNESEILLLDVKRQPSDPEFEDLGSTEFTIGFGEEVGEWDFMAYDILSTRVGRHYNEKYGIPSKLYLTCNPKKNWVYNTFYKPWTTNELPTNLSFVQSLITDNPKVDKEYIRRLQSLKSEAMKQKLLYGNWDYDDNPNDLVSYDAILNTFTNQFVKGGKKYLTIDVARFGKDKTVMRVWDGLRAIKRVAIKESDLNHVIKVAKELARAHGIPMSQVICDEDGIGGGVVDTLRCKGFVSNARPIKVKNNENYDNLKSQCAFKIAELIADDQVYDSEEQEQDLIIQELGQLKQKDRSTKNAIISKDEMKSNLGRSPDDLDNYIMRAYFEIKPALSKPALYRRYAN